MALNLEGHLQHIGVSTSNQKQTLAFFEAMGFSQFYESINPANAALVVFMQLGDIVIEVYLQKDSTSSPGAIDHIAISVPTLLIYLFLSKYMQEGLSEGAVKG